MIIIWWCDAGCWLVSGGFLSQFPIICHGILIYHLQSFHLPSSNILTFHDILFHTEPTYPKLGRPSAITPWPSLRGTMPACILRLSPRMIRMESSTSGFQPSNYTTMSRSKPPQDSFSRPASATTTKPVGTVTIPASSIPTKSSNEDLVSPRDAPHPVSMSITMGPSKLPSTLE